MFVINRCFVGVLVFDCIQKKQVTVAFRDDLLVFEKLVDTILLKLCQASPF